MSRQCARQGCVHPATVTLSYQYARSLVWLDNLSVERDPHCYDLCEQHAGRLTAPSGWHLEDRRQRIHVYAPQVSETMMQETMMQETMMQETMMQETMMQETMMQETVVHETVTHHAPEHSVAEHSENRLAG